MKRFPWLKLRKKTDPELPLEPPIWLNNHSNGEYYHQQTPREAAMKEEILKRADEQARHLGMERREFLASSMGMVTSLAVLNQMGCSSSDGKPSSGVVNGPYLTPVEAMCEDSDVLKGDEFIFDIQTHSFDHGEWRTSNTVYPTFLGLLGGCGTERADSLDCFDQERYARLMFAESDTTMAVITSWPAATCDADRALFQRQAKACGLPLSNDGMRNLRDWVNQRAASQRLVNQVQIMPNDNLELQLEIMKAAIEDTKWGAVSWKCYPAWRSDSYPSVEGYARGYFLSDKIGRKFIETGLELGVPNFAVHKGLPIPGFDVEHNMPTEIGTVAKDYPQANFIIYHSAIGAGMAFSLTDSFAGPMTELDPFNPADPNPRGSNMLIKSVVDAGLGPGSNVYAELGSAWSNVMSNTTAAQHLIGKLLKYIGEDNVVWGTDCILSGSPQAQIEAFRMFTITEQFQEQFGYPALTKEIKAKIFGLNAAKIFGIDPDLRRCTVKKDSFAETRRQLDGEYGPRRHTVQPPLGPTNRREFLASARKSIAEGKPA
ncbi:MAG: amidohydrolase family protein [Myxococcales bacterium]